MKYTFKPGDKVICIRGYDNQIDPIEGKIYTIYQIGLDFNQDEMVSIRNESKLSWYANRFKLANSHIICEKLGVK